MKRLRFPGAIAFVWLGIVVAAGQRAPDQQDSAQALQWPREPMHITRAPEPVVPVPSDADLGETTVALDASFWTPLGPAPIVNGQRPGGGPVAGRVTGIAAHPTDPMIIYLTAAGYRRWAKVSPVQAGMVIAAPYLVIFGTWTALVLAASAV